MRISDWSSDVCSSDLERLRAMRPGIRFVMPCASPERRLQLEQMLVTRDLPLTLLDGRSHEALAACNAVLIASGTATLEALLFKRRSEEHMSELQSLMRISYAVFCLKKKIYKIHLI